MTEMANAFAGRSRPPQEARMAIYVIIAVSALAYLVYEIRQHCLYRLDFEAQRIAAVSHLLDAVIAANALPRDAAGSPEPLVYVEEEGTGWFMKPSSRAATDRTSSLVPDRAAPGGTILAAIDLPVASLRNLPGIRALSLPEDLSDTGNRFLLTNGRLLFIFSNHNARYTLMLVAPIAVLFERLPAALSVQMIVIALMAALLILIRESRVGEYNVRRLVDASPVPLVVIDLATRDVALANEAAKTVFGAQANLTPLAGVRVGLAGQPVFLSRIMESPSRAEPQDAELTWPDGAKRWVSVSGRYLSFQGRPSLVAGISDITERRNAEASLRAAKEEAENASRAKSELLAIVSHELRTPVHGITGLAQLLEGAELPAQAKTQVRHIKRSAAALAAIVGDILDMASFELGQIRLRVSPFSLTQVLQTAHSLASAASARKGLQLELHVDSSIPAWLQGDAGRVQQIVNNMVANSVKFTDKGAITISARLLAPATDTAFVRVAVADTGVGLPARLHDKVFDLFWQASQGDRRRFGGIGLGLSICKRLVEAMGGQIGFESEVGRGTTFWFDVRHRRASAPISDVQEPTGSLHILLADDVPLNLEIAITLLESLSHRVVAVSSGADAIREALSQDFDLMILDVRMPDIDGVTAAAEIRERTKSRAKRPAIFGLTASPVPTQLPFYRISGFDCVLEKPLDGPRLVAAITQCQSNDTPPSIPSFDERSRTLIDRLGPTKTTRILELFLFTAGEALESIGRSCGTLAYTEIGEAAHKLGGAAANLGLDALQAAAGSLHQASEKRDGPETVRLAMKVVDAHEEATARVRNELRRLSTPPSVEFAAHIAGK